MILDAKDVFIAKRTYDISKKVFLIPGLPRTHEEAIEVEKEKRLIKVAIEKCRP